jgi:hypothetical protein
MDSNEQLMKIKGRFVALTNHPGWESFKVFSETILREMERAAINELDDTKANALRSDARGARRHWESLLKRVEMVKEIDSEDSFVEVVMD